MIDEPRLDLYPLDYDDTNHTGMVWYYMHYIYIYFFLVSITCVKYL